MKKPLRLTNYLMKKRISYNKRNEIAYLQIGVEELEGHVHGLQQEEIRNE
jgi:hypothetical protein